MGDEFIGPVRPMFNIKDEPPKKVHERLIAGSRYNGMMVDITEAGVEINAYYTSFAGPNLHAVLREPLRVSWEELLKIRGRMLNPGTKTAVLDRVDTELDAEYLETLPQVTINSKKYYIDPDRRERRSVENPYEVWKF